MDINFAIFLIGAGLLVYQRHYMNHHRPLIKAEAVAADSQGAGLLDEIGVPSGAAAARWGRKALRRPPAKEHVAWGHESNHLVS